VSVGLIATYIQSKNTGILSALFTPVCLQNCGSVLLRRTIKFVIGLNENLFVENYNQLCYTIAVL